MLHNLYNLIHILNSFTREKDCMEKLIDKISVMAGVYDQAILRAIHAARKTESEAEPETE